MLKQEAPQVNYLPIYRIYFIVFSIKERKSIYRGLLFLSHIRLTDAVDRSALNISTKISDGVRRCADCAAGSSVSAKIVGHVVNYGSC